MNEKEILIGLLTKTLNRSEQEVIELLYQKDDKDELILKDGAVDAVLELDSARVENIKKNAPVPKERLDNEYKRGRKEGLKELEGTVKEKYSIDSEKLGIELIDELLADKSKKIKITDDDVKKHPLYLDLEKSRIAKAEYDALKGEYDEFKTNIERDKKFSSIKETASSLLDSMKPIISENPAVAKTRKDDFLKKFESFDYQKDGDDTIILNPDGSRKEDKHGNPVTLEDFVKEIASLNYDFPKQDDKGNGGADDDGKKSFNFSVPKNDEEYVAAVRGAKTPEERIAIKTAYESKK